MRIKNKVGSNIGYAENNLDYLLSPEGRGCSPALSHCDIPLFIILSKQGGTLCINKEMRDAAPALQYRDKDYGRRWPFGQIPKREKRQ
jgi:hypothetical protein